MADFEGGYIGLPGPALGGGGVYAGYAGGWIVLGPPIGPPDQTPPVVDNFSPANGSELLSADPIFFDVTDDSGLFRRVLVAVEQLGTTEMVHDGDSFLEPYASLSSRTSIAGGFRYRLRRSGGWVDDVTVRVFPFDQSGNEST